MRSSTAIHLTIVLILLAVCSGSWAAEAAKPCCPKQEGLLHLKVDFAAVQGKDNPKPIPGTVKEGWWPWVMKDWDFYRSDLVWETGSGKFPAEGKGIADSGVHAGASCHYEGILTIYVAGMRRYLAGGVQPIGEPIHDPICNTWIAGSDFPDNPTSDVIIPIYGLKPGKYRLKSYHNSFNGKRIGNNPTGVEYEGIGKPEPPMKSIKVYPLKTIVKDYFERPEDALIKGKSYETPKDKMTIKGLEGTGNVTQTLEAKNVVIQQVTKDSELKPSIVEFITDGSPVVVVYAGGCCKSDDLRKGRKGGYAVLNAFELIQLAGAAPCPVGK